MNYVLAKELEEAGFPQGGDGKWIGDPGALVVKAGDRVYGPTLSELIHASGDGLYKLIRHEEGWIAYDRDDLNTVFCPTAEEAVARLWLALRAN